ncbi:MAG: hypothetical protein D5R96_09240, partial [Methanocalculus sp. MSAO_Arc2]|uniref:hypothetical protein n=1 Tax=Methanocalculus sp. MSAO_Arc2 TaxID=2293855 RepID=UPI000FF49B64
AWAKETAGIAQDLMAEIDSTMTIISGRITFISHMLEELEESTAAGTLLSAIDSAAIDDLLAHYHVFAAEYRKGIHQDIQLALNAAAIAGKLERLVDRGTLDPFIEPFILEHLDELINDYMIIFRGYQPVSTRIPADPVLICRSIIDSLTASSSPPVFDLDSDEAFVNALARQMGRMEVVSEGTVWLRCKDGSSSASMDPLRFERAVRRLILEYAASGVEEIGIIIDRIDHDRVRITFRPDRIFPGSLAMRYFRHAFSFSGGTMLESGGDISIIYPPGEIII